MKRLLLASASLMALMAGSAAAATFDFTGSVVDYPIVSTGNYQIIAYGAQGGSNGSGAAGRLGAEVTETLHLYAGSKLQIAVGGAGGAGTKLNPSGYAAGGGGGTFVTEGDVGLAIAIAGGGGGAGGGAAVTTWRQGYSGQTGRGGTDGFGKVIHRGVGGSNGSGASGGGEGGGGGGGGLYGSGSAGVADTAVAGAVAAVSRISKAALALSQTDLQVTADMDLQATADLVEAEGEGSLASSRAAITSTAAEVEAAAAREATIAASRPTITLAVAGEEAARTPP